MDFNQQENTENLSSYNPSVMRQPIDFYNKDFLQQHCQSILDFYNPRVIDKTGGYFQNFYDDGSLFQAEFRQLVSSTRIIINYAFAVKWLGKTEYIEKVKHGLDYLENVHWQEKTQQYAWTLTAHKPLDMTQQAYGYAFVLLAYAACKNAGIISHNDKLNQTYELLEQRFWQAEYGLYADTLSVDGQLSDYRGQNANMHICEAMLAAYEATQDKKYLQRANTIAENICQRQADLSDGLIWEHFREDFQIDWQYNKDDPKNLYRPWGFQPGHQTEWTKLLLQLNRYQPATWLVEKAKTLFDRAYDVAWDHEHGGLIYGFDPEGKWCDTDKYFWVQAESFAAAAMLYQATKQQKYLDKYQQLWQYCWQVFVDHKHGAWFRLLDQQNQAYNNEKSAAGAKCDYHTLGACVEVLKHL